ncbi:MAG TPA: YciI family protein [Longimicrobium sp.]|nr:YciI family protein [Longimicrobium sp.]
MRYVCLIHWNEQELATLPGAELDALNAAHLDFNDAIRASGHLLHADALMPPRESACLRVKGGKPFVTDGPFTEAKEMIAGFYVLEVRDRDEALEIAARIPSAGYATIEVRPVHILLVEGRGESTPELMHAS